MEDDVGKKIAQVCIETYRKLGKTGKAIPGKEWTIFSAFVMSRYSQLHIVSIGTGTKCMGQNSLSPNGDILNDSHAEIVARRGFVKFVYREMAKAIDDASEFICFQPKKNRFEFKEEIKFHLFTTCSPCGDATIFTCPSEPMGREEPGAQVGKKRKVESTQDLQTVSQTVSTKMPRLSEDASADDLNRTGAKCLPGAREDPKLPGVNYHAVGLLRTKPGRGDPTLSMSCSDKIAKWNILGIQGSLLMQFLERPVYLSSVVYGKCEFSESSTKRAVFDRFRESALQFFMPVGFAHTCPQIVSTQVDFPETERLEQSQPAPGSILWYMGVKSQEVIVDGKKLGVTKKNRNTPKGRVSICKKVLFQDYLSLREKLGQTGDNLHLSYKEAKELSVDYMQLWNCVKQDVFGAWSEKPDSLQSFLVQD